MNDHLPFNPWDDEAKNFAAGPAFITDRGVGRGLSASDLDRMMEAQYDAGYAAGRQDAQTDALDKRPTMFEDGVTAACGVADDVLQDIELKLGVALGYPQKRRTSALFQALLEDVHRAISSGRAWAAARPNKS